MDHVDGHEGAVEALVRHGAALAPVQTPSAYVGVAAGFLLADLLQGGRSAGGSWRRLGSRSDERLSYGNCGQCQSEDGGELHGGGWRFTLVK